MDYRDPFNRFVLILYGATILALFLLVAAIPKGADVIAINGLHMPWLDRYFVLITNLGDGLIFVPILLLLAFIRFEYSAIAAGAWILHGILSTILKRLVFSSALRPKEVVDNSLLYFVPGVEVNSYFSFPSGHTMTAFCAAFLISVIARKKWLAILLLAIALDVGCSRIYLLQHFLVDVAGGALVGVFSAWAVFVAFSKMRPAPWRSGRIRLGGTNSSALV